jgi:hypothetical protein
MSVKRPAKGERSTGATMAELAADYEVGDSVAKSALGQIEKFGHFNRQVGFTPNFGHRLACCN